ncbi:GDSL family lipase [Sporolactobacillus sp. THM19-2]|nr:GDSL family lipase [Sporolactobacillus sp. THM19-2]
MKRTIIILFILLVLVAAVFGLYHLLSRDREEKPVTYSYQITALGDSLTEGVGDEKNKGYVGRTVQSLKKQKQVRQVSFKDFGHRGDTSRDLIIVLNKPEVRESIKQSNTIFLTIGGNDIVRVLREHFMDLSTADFEKQQKIFGKNLNIIFSELRKINPEAHIYFLGLYNPFEEYLGDANRDFVPLLNKWNEGSKSIAEKYRNITFIPTSDIFRGSGDSLLYEDHFHPNNSGYQKMSRRLLYAIDKRR